MGYSAWMSYGGLKPILHLSDAEYSAVAFAWRALAAVAEIEDLWEIVIQNYVDLEGTLLRSALQSMVSDSNGHSQGQDERLRITRLLSNMLHSCRAYIYQVERNLKGAGREDTAEAFKRLVTQGKRNNSAFAFMEALRNYAQHYGLPLHGTSVGGSWSLVETKRGLEKGTYRFSASASIALNKLSADPEFPKSALARFPNQDRLDVARMAREYIEALSQIHDDLRHEMSASVAEWKDAIRALLERYAANANCTPAFILIGEYSRDEPSKGTQIFEDMLGRIEEMVRRNRVLTNLHRRYVSNELTK